MKKLSWRALNDQIAGLSEADILKLLNEERSTDRRVSHLQRLHQRYCALRDARERLEILAEAVRP
jgi:hypothetical protein